MRILGIDPGLSGGLCIIENDNIYDLRPMPIYELKNKKALHTANLKLIINEADIIIIEDVHAMPKQGVTSSFNFGKGFGIIQGICIGLGKEIKLISPMKWKKEMGVTSDKGTSIEKALQINPDINLMATPRSRKPHDGMAEAFLIAKYYLMSKGS